MQRVDGCFKWIQQNEQINTRLIFEVEQNVTLLIIDR